MYVCVCQELPSVGAQTERLASDVELGFCDSSSHTFSSKLEFSLSFTFRPRRRRLVAETELVNVFFCNVCRRVEVSATACCVLSR